MPERTETINIPDYNVYRLMPLCYGVAEELQWTLRHAEDGFLGFTTRPKWGSTGEEVLITIKDNEVVITSRLAHNELLDLKGANRKHIKSFRETLLSLAATVTDIRLSEWTSQIESVKIISAEQLAAELKEAEELDTVMKFSSSNAYLTYGIIAINIIVFILMAISGVSLFAPTGQDIVNWGGNFGPFTSNGDWWRLITSVFVHIGIVHLLFNMYALFMAGTYLEPMLGKVRFIVAYLCTGVCASLVSLWWHKEPIASAGASGAIFGMFGVFLALLSTKLIPPKIRRQLLQGIAIFVGYNLVNGLKDGIDNAAHVGGLISGLAIGYLFYLDLRKKGDHGHTIYKPVIVCAVTVFAVFFMLSGSDAAPRGGDREEFSKTLEHFAVLEELAMQAMEPRGTSSREEYLQALKKTALEDWVQCVNLFDEAASLKLDPQLESLRTSMLEYSNDRVQQTLLYIKAAEENSSLYDDGIDSIQQKIDRLVKKLEQTGQK